MECFSNTFVWYFCSTSGHFLSASGLLLHGTFVVLLPCTFLALLGHLCSASGLLLPSTFVIISPSTFVILFPGIFRALLSHFLITFGVFLE